MLKSVIFDFDGVLADTFDLYYRLSREFHPALSAEDFKDHHNGNVFSEPKIKFNESEISIFFRRSKEEFLPEYLLPFEGLLHKLSIRYNLYIISSTNDENLDYYLGLGGLNKYFKQILGSTTHKSKEYKFQKLFVENELLPKECVFVTDTTGDIIEADKVGLNSIAVSWGFHERERLELLNPWAIVDDINELASAIDQYAVTV